MSRFWSPLVDTLKPYVAGEQPQMRDLVKLNTNENPYGPSPRALAAIKAAADDALRLYPDPMSTKLREAVAAHHRVKADQIFVGNSSDEVLALVFQALLKHERPLAFPDVTYSFYPVWCGLYGVSYREVPLDGELRIDIDAFPGDCGAIIFANPNAPTGHALARAEIERLLKAHPDIPVVIDEAYVDFGAESTIPLIAAYPNLLVTHTLSKSRSLAGLRIGLAFGQRDLIDALERVKDSFNSYPLDRLAQAGATAAYEDVDWFEQCRAKVIASRERLTDSLRKLGFDVLPSKANFVFARHPVHAAADLQRALREKAIIVRRFDKPRTKDFLRITVGTDAECERLAAALKEILRWNEGAGPR
ncbi:MAG: histidinol-phosphate transaminase [Hyphomicrobiales bacterium]|nr:histidinol-phosphate transaminase [Hyphomicrobiales bacterium]